MKNFMKKKIRRAMESWPRRKPCVKESLKQHVSGVILGILEREIVRRATLVCCQWYG